MQTQDIKYITMKKTIEGNKIRKMQSELHMIDEANNIKNTHTFFTDSGDEDMDLDIAKRLNTHPALLHRRTNRPRLEDLDKIKINDADIEVELALDFFLFTVANCKSSQRLISFLYVFFSIHFVR